MAFATLRRLNTLKPGFGLVSRFLTSHSSPSHIAPVIPPAITQNPWIWQKNNPVRLPVVSRTEFQLPNTLRWTAPIEEPPMPAKDMELPPTSESEISKEAVRMIVRRRKKMKKHKLKKLRKKMKYEWAKLRQRRELRKEKAFQAVLIAQCKEAEAFSAEQYVMDKLKHFNSITKA